MTDLATLELRVKATEVDRARDSLGRFTKAGKQAEGSALGFGKSARSLEKGAGSLNRALGGLVATMLSFQAARKATSILQTFEDGMIRVRKTTGLTGAALTGLERDLENLATNSSLAVGGLFEIAESAGQLGIRGADDIGSFTDAIAKLADAAPSLAGDIGNTSLEMGKLLSITNSSAKETFNLASVIARLGDEYATTEDKVLGTGLEIAKAGSAYGVSASNALGLAAAFDSVGTEAEAARTAVLTVFSEMEKAIGQGGEELEVFATLTGQSVQGFADSFGADAVGAFENFAIGLGQFIEQGGKSSLLLDRIGLASKRVSASLLPLAKNSDRLSDVLATASDEFGRGEKLQREFEIGSDRLTAAMVRLENSTSVMVDNLLDDESGLSGGLRSVVEGATDAIRVLGGMDDQVRGNEEQADKFAAGIVGLTSALAAYAIGAGVAAIATATLGAVLFANPLGAIALTIGAAAGAFYAYRDSVVAVGGELTTVGDIAEAVFEILADRAQTAFSLMVDFAAAGAAGVGHLFFLLGKGFSFVLGEMLDATLSFSNKLIGLFAIPLEYIGTRFARVADAFNALSNLDIKNPFSVAEAARASKELLSVSTSFDDLGQSVEDALDRNYIGEATDAGIETGKEFAQGIAEGMKKGLAIAISATGKNPFEVLRKFSADGIKEDFAAILAGKKGTGDAGTGGVFDPMAENAKAATVETGKLLASVDQIGLELAELGKSGAGGNGIAGLLGGGSVSAADQLQGPLADLNLQIGTALSSDRDAAKASALAGIKGQLDSIGLSAQQQAPYLAHFDQKLEDLADLNRIREVSREFATAFGGALRDVITDIDNLEDAFKRLGDNLAGIAIDRFVVDPFVDNLAGGFADLGADAAGIDPTSTALAGLAVPTNLASSAMTSVSTASGAATISLEALATAASTAASASTASTAIPALESAQGNVFGGNGVQYFANGAGFGRGRGLADAVGDVLNQGPVPFPLGVAGEAGTEVIMPGNEVGGGFGINGQLGGQRVKVPLMRDSGGSLAVDLEAVMQKRQAFKDGGVFGGFSRGSGGASRSGGSGDTYQFTHNWNITTQDADSFRRSSRSLQDKAASTFKPRKNR